ncbi:T9SS type A sorting domain-containing protein [candidate division KSB1 bacterium]|nr:T9SS type A sorting domain-containing protein [candidate division KSB1 bacterium]
MRRQVYTIFLIVLALSSVFILSKNVVAQDSDTLDVVADYESLNLAIEGDTTETGEPKNYNRVYRLERGGWYLLNGTLENIKDAPLRIVAAKGEGPRPMLIASVDESGGTSKIFTNDGDAEWRGLYVTGINNLGNQGNKNNFTINKEEGRYIMDDCFLDDDRQAFFRMNSPNQKLYITNSIFRNAERQADPWDGIMIAARGGIQDTIFVQNCTFYVASNRIMDDYNGKLKNVIFDHNTFDEYGGVVGGNLAVDQSVNLTITNNLFTDVGYEGGRVIDDELLPGEVDTFAVEIFGIDSLEAPELASDDQRHIVIKNNVYGWSPEVIAWMDSKPDRKLYEFNNLRTQLMIAGFPNMVSENNIEEYPGYSDPPDIQVQVDYAEYRWATGGSNENNPPIWADRNGRNDLTIDATTMGPAEDEYDFDYPTTSQAYTHAQGGFPVGDLNWFPDKKAEWEAWIQTSVDGKNNNVAPAEFALQQNYPNPFNPSTTISYQLNKSSVVKLSVFNTLGQKVRVLVSDIRQNAGTHSVQWDGLDDSHKLVSSGFYFYRLEANNQVLTKKMLLMK